MLFATFRDVHDKPRLEIVCVRKHRCKGERNTERKPEDSLKDRSRFRKKKPPRLPTLPACVRFNRRSHRLTHYLALQRAITIRKVSVTFLTVIQDVGHDLSSIFKCQ